MSDKVVPGIVPHTSRKVRIHFNIDKQTYDYITILSTVLGISKSEVVRRAIRKYYDEMTIKISKI